MTKGCNKVIDGLCPKHKTPVEKVYCGGCVHLVTPADYFERHVAPAREAPAPTRETKVCKHRGEPDGTCNCGSAKFKCNLIGITVRNYRRPNHPADIACDVCPKKEF